LEAQRAMAVQFPINAFLDSLDPDPAQALRLGRELGIHCYALRFFPSGRFPAISDEDWRWIKATHDEGACGVESVSPGVNKGLFEASSIDAITDQIQETIDKACKIGVRKLSLFTWRKTAHAAAPRGDTPSPDMPTAIPNLLYRMADAAENAGLRLTIENEPTQWGDTGLAVESIILAADHRWMRVLWDPANSLAARAAWGLREGDRALADPTGVLIDELRQLADRLEDVHVRDIRIASDGRWRWVPLGEGVIDWPRLLEALDQAGYRGGLTLEPHLQPKNERARHAVDYLRSIMQASAA